MWLGDFSISSPYPIRSLLISLISERGELQDLELSADLCNKSFVFFIFKVGFNKAVCISVFAKPYALPLKA
jgi:hypothetical protein